MGWLLRLQCALGRVRLGKVTGDEVTGDAPHDDAARSWRGWRQALAVLRRPGYLRRTTGTALIVGTVLFAINQLNVVLAGHATTVVWVKAAVTYVVPFTVSNVGILIASRE